MQLSLRRGRAIAADYDRFGGNSQPKSHNRFGLGPTAPAMACPNLPILFILSCICVACGATTSLPPQAVLQNQRGTQALNAGELEDAEARFRLALEFHPRFAEAHANLGALKLYQGHPEQAETHLRDAIALNPEFDEAWANLGLALDAQDDVQGAREAYEQALAIDPGHQPARRNLVSNLLQRGLFVPARAHLLRWIQLTEAGSRSWGLSRGLLAYTELHLRRPEAALERVTEVLEADPDSGIAHLVLGIHFASAGDYPRALRSLERAQNLPVLQSDATLRRASILIVLGRLTEARPLIDALNRHRDDAAMGLLEAAYALAAGDLESCRTHAEAVLEDSPDIAAAQELRDLACADLGC